VTVGDVNQEMWEGGHVVREVAEESIEGGDKFSVFGS
jgi:hypothetical protein